MSDPLEHLSRVAGLVAYLLLWLSICVGLALSTRVSLPWLMRWRMADLHQFIGVLAIVFVALHMAVLVGLAHEPFSLAELWVPHLRSLQAALGIAALYLVLAVMATSYLRRFLSRHVWRTVHGLSVLAYALGLAHALLALGAAPTATWVQLMYVATNVLLLGLLGRRFALTRRSSLRPAAHSNLNRIQT